VACLRVSPTHQLISKHDQRHRHQRAPPHGPRTSASRCIAHPVSDSAAGATSPPLLLLFGKHFPTLRATFPGRDPPHSFRNKVDGRVRGSLITKDRVHHLPPSFVLALQHRSRSSSAISTTLTLAYGLSKVSSSSSQIDFPAATPPTSGSWSVPRRSPHLPSVDEGYRVQRSRAMIWIKEEGAAFSTRCP
jgi:hypothetical protein